MHHCQYCQFCQSCPHYHLSGATVFSCHDWWTEEGPGVKKSFSIVSYKSRSTRWKKTFSQKKTIAIYDDHKNCGFVRFVFLSAKRCLVKTLSDKEDEFKLSLKVKKEQCNFQGLFVWTVFVFPKTYTYCIEELGLYLCFLKTYILLKNEDCICVS